MRRLNHIHQEIAVTVAEIQNKGNGGMITRIISAVIGIAAVIVLLIFRFTVAMPIGLAFISAVGVYEIFRATHSRYNAPMFILSELFAIALPFCVRYFTIPLNTLYYIYFALFAAALMFKFETKRMSRCFVSFVMVCSLTFGLSCAYTMFYWNYGMFYFLLAAFCAFITDSGAYFVGSAIGKHHFAPVVSPHKTVEGSIGGLASSLVVNIIFAFIYSYGFAQGAKINFAVLIVTVLVASVAGMIGDLFASAVKRTYGIKDYGKIMPGHGGIMDRCDSLVFSLSAVMLIAQHFTVF